MTDVDTLIQRVTAGRTRNGNTRALWLVWTVLDRQVYITQVVKPDDFDHTVYQGSPLMAPLCISKSEYRELLNMRKINVELMKALEDVAAGRFGPLDG